MKKRRLLLISIIFAVTMFAGSAFAAPSVDWIDPADGSSYAAGTIVAVTGQASCTGAVGGTGLDLVLVLDSSGSMATTSGGKTRSQWMKEAAIALVDNLPVGTTSVGVVEFDSDANTVKTLLALSTKIDEVKAAINGVDASGGTNIGSGINEAASVLTGATHTAGRSQMMVVVSDGSTSGDPYVNASNAIVAGVDAIHTVGIPGHNVSTMQDIVSGSDNTYGNSDDWGVYTDASDLSTLTGIFDGTGGSLVGIDRVEVELNDGTILNSANGDFTVSGLGTFTIPNQEIVLGANTFVATAYCTDGLSADDSLTLYGAGDTPPIPEPATLLLFGFGLLGVAGVSRKK